MSAPNTNPDREARRHKPAMTGIAVAVILAIVALVGFALWPGPADEEQAAPPVTEEALPDAEPTEPVTE